MIAFRQECRAYAEHWLEVQREEFKRLGVEGDWDHPYTTMSFPAEAQIARELMKFAANGTLYRGSKPVMWSVVEKTALAEAEVEYEDYVSDQVWVKFPVASRADGSVDMAQDRSDELRNSSDAQCFGRDLDNHAMDASWQPRDQLFAKIAYGLYRVTDAPPDNWAKIGDILCPRRQAGRDVFKQARSRRVTRKLRDVPSDELSDDRSALIRCKSIGGYDFDVPLLAGDHVTDDAGTGFVHTAPGHGREDFEIWTANARALEAARHQHRPSPTPSTRTAPSPSRRPASPASASSTTRARRATPTRP